MKEDELRQHAECSLCHQKIGHTGLPLFWTARVARYGINLDAIRRHPQLTFIGE